MAIIDLTQLPEAPGIGRVHHAHHAHGRRGHRMPHLHARMARRHSVRAARKAARATHGMELVLVGCGATQSPAAGASQTFTVRAQKDQHLVGFFLGSTNPEDLTVTAFSIAGKNVLRGSGAAAVGSFQAINTVRPGYCYPHWNGGSDLVVTVKNNHATLARPINGAAVVLREKTV